jgi:hypothetical protein
LIQEAVQSHLFGKPLQKGGRCGKMAQKWNTLVISVGVCECVVFYWSSDQPSKRY